MTYLSDNFHKQTSLRRQCRKRTRSFPVLVTSQGPRLTRWSAVEKSSWPTTILDTYEQCSPNYPVTKKLLLMYATLPVSSATAERSFSTLNHIKSYRRATMGEDRLNGLAKKSRCGAHETKATTSSLRDCSSAFWRTAEGLF